MCLQGTNLADTLQFARCQICESYSPFVFSTDDIIMVPKGGFSQ